MIEKPGVDAGPLAEYVALRAEFERRASGQWSVLALQITIAGAVFGFALSAQNREIFLLVVPIASYMTCGRFILHTRGLRMIAAYVQESLSDRVPGGLRWDRWRTENLARFPIGHFGVAHYTGVVFPGVSLLAIGSFVLSALSNSLADGRPWYVVTAVVAIVIVDLVLSGLIVQALWTGRRMA